MPNTEAQAGLADFNAMDRRRVERVLSTCCAAPDFAGKVAGSRPFADLAELVAAGVRAVQELEWDEVLQALAAHPRIGERAAGTGREAVWSRGEQAGVEDGADDGARRALAEGNQAYEARFGHVYLVCATGLNGGELLARLRGRLTHDEETERRVVRDELAAITALRLAKLVGTR